MVSDSWGQKQVQFNRDIRPILSDKCFVCHGPDAKNREAELRLDQRASAVDDQDRDPAIMPGHSDQSEIMARILSEDEDVRMPPGEHGKRLSAKEIGLLKDWIQQGAEYQEHWSITPLKKPAVPKIDQANKKTSAIDAFILSRLKQEKLAPSKAADPRTLVRRLSFDLTGLPPSPELVETFANDPSPEAYEKLVNQLIQSSHYGERMAIYWLDLVRYADTLGYHGDQVRSVSPYRDYVINAFNQNKPFDEFTIEQIAGDLLHDATLDQKVASTYNRLNRASAEGGGQPKEYLAKYAADRVRTTGNIWLGSTFGCAECHDHKFDSFTTKDFYSFAAFFADIKEKGIVGGANHLELLPVPTAEQQQESARLTKEIAATQTKYDTKSPELEAEFIKWQQSLSQQSGRWKLLTPTSATSSGGSTMTIEKDGSIKASGKVPDKDVYTISLELNAPSIAALRLECLTDDSFPAKGPGRAINGNFVLHKVEAKLGDQNIAWASAEASHTQNNHSPTYIINGNKNGWAILPQTGQTQQLVLSAKKPVSVKSDAKQTLEVKLTHNYGTGHSLGKIRLYAAEASGDNNTQFASPALLAIISIDPAKRTKAQNEKLWNEFKQQSELLKTPRDLLAKLKADKTKLDKSVITTLATKAGPPRVMRILPRGDWMDDSGEIVTPSVPAFLPQPKIEGRTLNRKDLADWLVSKENPLVARTFVNRIWMLYFGNGLSRSVDDLGSQGETPSHPELLDWLAADFIDSGWDIKHLVKQMVLSNSYQQSSYASQEDQKSDPYNRLLARQSRWRLDAEMVRDNALVVSGLMVDKIGGVSAKPYQPAGYWAQMNFPKRTYKHDSGDGQYRRGLYTHWQRTFLHPSMLAFDAPPREECTARRERSNTPLQALVLLNDPTYVEAARVFAEKILLSGNKDFETRLTWAFNRALSRPPRTDEMVLLKQWYEKNLAIYQKSPESAAKLAAAGIAPKTSDLDTIELAAWTSVTRAILNLHEGITRY